MNTENPFRWYEEDLRRAAEQEKLSQALQRDFDRECEIADLNRIWNQS